LVRSRSNGLHRYTRPRIALDIDLVKYYSLNGKKSRAGWELAGLSVDEIPKLLLVNGSGNPRPRFQNSNLGAPFGSLGAVNERESPSPIESTLRGRLYCHCRGARHHFTRVLGDPGAVLLRRRWGRLFFASGRHNSLEPQIGHHVPIVLIGVRRIDREQREPR
jgi:hypothetical protein